MWILPFVGYLGMILGFGFLTLAIASGLYYLSELVEEHTVVAKKLLIKLIYGIIGLQASLWLIDGLPFLLSMLSIVSHVVYLGNMRRFPIVKLSDPLFISSCFLVLLNHYVWFVHFSSPAVVTTSIYDRPSGPTFTEIASYFGLCVWLVPFALFVSLSAGDNVLPTMSSSEPGEVAGMGMGVKEGRKSQQQGMAKALVEGVRTAIGTAGETIGIWKTAETSF